MEELRILHIDLFENGRAYSRILLQQFNPETNKFQNIPEFRIINGYASEEELTERHVPGMMEISSH